MAKRVVSVTTQTPTATADATNLVDATYPFIIKGGTSTQRTAILELYLGGQALTSSPTYMILGRDSQVATGSNSNGAGQNDTAMDAATAALVAPALTGNTNATLKPQRDATAKLLNLSFNAFGGVVRWVAAPGEEVYVVGNTASLGQASFSAFTGGTVGVFGTHMVYENGLMPAFKQGQKVVCVDNSGIDPPYGEAVPVEGRTYTIRNEVGECVRLVEIRNQPNEYREGTMECLFKGSRFKRKTGKP